MLKKIFQNTFPSYKQRPEWNLFLCLTLCDKLTPPTYPFYCKCPWTNQIRTGSISEACVRRQTVILCSVQLLSCVRLFVACLASLSITNSRNLLKLISVELVMPSNHLILCHPFLLLPSIFPSIRVFSCELVLCIRWPKYWSFSFSISPSNEYSGNPDFL